MGAVAPFGADLPATTTSSSPQDDLQLVASPPIAIRLPTKCGKGRSSCPPSGSDTDSDSQSTKSSGSGRVARTFKKSFKGKAVAIVKPFSNVGNDKRSPGPVKEAASSSKADLLNQLYDFKSDEEASASSGGVLAGQTEASAAVTVKDCGGGNDNGHTTPPASASSASSATAVKLADDGGSSSVSPTSAAKKTRGSGLKSNFLPRRLKFGAELKAVRVRVEKLQQGPTRLHPVERVQSCATVPAKKDTEVQSSSADKNTSDGSSEATSSLPSVKCEIKAEPEVTRQPGDSSSERRQSDDVVAVAISTEVKPGKAPSLSRDDN